MIFPFDRLWLTIPLVRSFALNHFFLVATAFLSAAFVTAAKEKMYLLAGGVAILAICTSYFLYRIERRIQSLLHAAEAAIGPLEDKLAQTVNIDALRIVSVVENEKAGEWKYSKVFRYLYFSTAAAFTLGLLYVCWAAFSATQGAAEFRLVLEAVVGLSLIVCGYEIAIGLPSIPQPDQVERVRRWSMLALGIAAILSGVVIVLHLVFLRL
jgi:hypothetical protein